MTGSNFSRHASMPQDHAAIKTSPSVMLHGTIRNDDFQRNTALQCQNSVATLCCAKNRPCESSRVTSP